MYYVINVRLRMCQSEFMSYLCFVSNFGFFVVWPVQNEQFITDIYWYVRR